MLDKMLVQAFSCDFLDHVANMVWMVSEMFCYGLIVQCGDSIICIDKIQYLQGQDGITVFMALVYQVQQAQLKKSG